MGFKERFPRWVTGVLALAQVVLTAAIVGLEFGSFYYDVAHGTIWVGFWAGIIFIITFILILLLLIGGGVLYTWTMGQIRPFESSLEQAAPLKDSTPVKIEHTQKFVLLLLKMVAQWPMQVACYSSLLVRVLSALRQPAKMRY